MKLKRTVLGLLSVVIMSGAFVGCSTSNVSTGLTEDGQILLEISTEPKDADEKLYNSKIEKYAKFEEYFKTEYPESKGVHIEPHYYQYSVKDYAAVATSGMLPTYYNVHMTEGKAIIDAGYAKDITKWMEEYGYKDGMDEKMLKNIVRDGKYYLMPKEVYSVGIAVNIDILKQAGYVSEDGTPYQPKDYEELAQMASDIKKKTGKPGLILLTMSNQGGWRFTPIAWAYGVDFMEQDKDGKWHATFNTPECVAALQWVKDLKWKYDALPEDALMDNSKMTSVFAAGEGAMTFAEGNNAYRFINAGMSKDNLGYIQLPAGPKRHVTLVGGMYYVFNSNVTDEQIDAAFKYLDWNGEGRSFDDNVKKNMEDQIKLNVEQGALIGVLAASPYTAKDPKRAFEISLNTEKYANINMNHVKHYNDNSEIEWQEEEPIEAQTLYALLDNAIQAVLTDKDADCAKLIEEACKNFQTTLDIVNNE